MAEITIGKKIASEFFAGPLYEARLAKMIDASISPTPPAEPTPKVRRFVNSVFPDSHTWSWDGATMRCDGLLSFITIADAINYVYHHKWYEIDADGNRIEVKE